MIEFVTRSSLEVNSELAFTKVNDCPADLRYRILEELRGTDVLTPIANGKEWLFEYLLNYQPKTGNLLMTGGELFVVGKMHPLAPKLSLHIVVNGMVISIGCKSGIASPSNIHYQPFKTERHLSLPKAISDGYYFRYDGLGIPKFAGPGSSGLYLPGPSGASWVSIDGFLANIHLKKQKLPLIEEMISDVKPLRKTDPYTNFMCFLDTRGSSGERNDFDALFVKNHIQDGIIYLIHNRDIDNMMILNDPVTAIDEYCAHVLSRREGRFNFLKYSRAM